MLLNSQQRVKAGGISYPLRPRAPRTPLRTPSQGGRKRVGRTSGPRGCRQSSGGFEGVGTWEKDGIVSDRSGFSLVELVCDLDDGVRKQQGRKSKMSADGMLNTGKRAEDSCFSSLLS